MKTLGLIGGTSWHSTIDYYRLINQLSQEKLGDGANPPLMLYSINIAVMREMNIDKINATYLDVSNKLIKSGADAIMICANTPHLVYPYLAPKVHVPVIHIADGTARRAKELGIRKLGLLGTKATMERDFMKMYLRDNHQMDSLTPGLNGREEIHRLISEELTRGKFTEEAKAFIIEEMDKLKLQGAEAIVLGCTELPMLLKQEDFDLPLLNTTLLHAQLAVDFIFSEDE